ncbi:ATP-binding sensor histidine kinase [Kamptonema sp. UHCC 0994]|uniref:trifunctional serine/threonine-protein kinase/ATP-binding protein/sensor histidine kinase n=1 Tax=Kamptonema sp. UHCC 0994 TaxID=3031329 RepID=UPI0023B9D15B|nr:ATP-binding sensor histidine kinase [Kamptonema sp. UHCC 0994]MDF0552377.1 AAA family ATPase [Kamptonema sp. UHCC 0994]
MENVTHLPGYTITEQIYAGSRTFVYRGIRERDRTPVAIKLLRNDYPNFNELLQFRNQYTIAKNLKFPSIIQPLTLEQYHNSYALVMEDFGGVSLSNYLKIATDETKICKSLPLVEFLNIAIQLTDILHYLYQNRVIHKDIKPANILINPDTKQIKLIDFSISSLLPRETQEIQNPNILEGTLAYLSPEQTGRMNRGIDYRSDFYSLGITFYELLTGELPFISEDAMELVHCHLAKQPILIHQINAEIPSIISEIVSKLMAKNAEDRYQSALGLKHDLDICLEQLQTRGNIEKFELGKRDISDRFTIPEKLYGREKEVNQLLAAFERVNTGAAEMMLVAGFSGIGKTAVVNEVHKPIVRQHGYFIKGKYDQFQRNIPFSAFVQAFRDLIGQLLSENDAQIQQWKNQILAAVGENGQVLIDVIPELENIIGKQPPATQLSGSAAQNRFDLLLPKFVQVFTSKEHPLVMFLDDLQWSDSASLNLLKLLMQDTEYLLILGAYRDNEVSPVHPFILTLEEIVKNQATVNIITLLALSEVNLNQLIADTLNCESHLAYTLTKLVYQKTQGNPFFATQFLKALHSDQLISFNSPDSQGGRPGGWQCDLAQVKALAITNDVVEFMALQLQKLPIKTQEMLKLAACIGAEFDLNTLIIVSEKSTRKTAKALWKTLQEGLVIPTTKIYKFFTQSDSEEVFKATANPTYRFLHDRVQQAAYSLILDDQKQATHLKIGQLLLKNIPEAQQEEKIFDIVNQLNYGVKLIAKPKEREQLARLNLVAGTKAKAATAYNTAFDYFAVGRELLQDDRWQSQYELTLKLFESAAEAAYLNGEFEAMEELIEEVLQSAGSLLERVKVYEIKLQAYAVRNQFVEAIKIAFSVLKLFGVSFPESPTDADIQRAFADTKSQWSDRPIEQLKDLPTMSDLEKMAALRILSSIIGAAYIALPQFLPFIVCEQVKLSIKYGNAPWSAFSYAIYGTTLCGVLGDIESGYQFGQLALNILSKFDAKEIAAKVFINTEGDIRHWKEPARDTIKPLFLAYQIGLETGDLEFAAYCACYGSFNSYFSGSPLKELESEIARYSQAFQEFKQETVFYWSEIHRQGILNLIKPSSHPGRLVGEAYNEEESLAFHYSFNDLLALHMVHSHKLILNYLFDRVEEALENAAIAEQYLNGVTAMFVIPAFYLYDSLARLQWLNDRQDYEIKNQLNKVADNQDKMQKWATDAPMNHLHKWQLVEAEKYRVLGKCYEAGDFYDRAISGAKENEYIQEEALANELAAKFYLNWGKEKLAALYMQEAYYCYAHWGAKAKINHLQQRYPQLLAPILQQPRTTNSFKETLIRGTIASTHTSSSASEALDLATLLKASQAISGEIELNKLLTTLLEIVITNAGASKCVLLLKQELDLNLVALVEGGQSPQLLPSIPLESSPDIAISLVNNVKRTLSPLVLADARINSQFAGDIYIQKYQPKSILCSPIMNQGQLIGVLYLENNLTVGAFTSERIEVLNLICSQAAISLENARLYQAAQQALTDLKQAQLTIVQSEKMSALGNLVAGVAHEINNPVGFLTGNIEPALDYINDLFGLINLFQQEYPNYSTSIQAEIEAIELEYIREDLPKLVSSMQEGVKRIQDISTSLRTFSRADTNHPVACNIHEGIDSTIMILKHRLKANENRPEIKVIKDYGNLPQIECYAGQLNQVFMNLLSNAIDAVEESNTGHTYGEINNEITVKTELTSDKKQAIIRIKDNGIGMNADVQSKIFEHLFTTKEVGKGTGLGLAIARQIIEEKHQGKIKVDSAPAEVTVFEIAIPCHLRE